MHIDCTQTILKQTDRRKLQLDRLNQRNNKNKMENKKITNRFRQLTRLIVFSLFLIISNNLIAEAPLLKGKVSDAKTNLPLYGATIRIVGTQKGTTSNASGEFALRTVSGETVVLEISYVGYATQQIQPTSSTDNIEIQLVPQAMLSEVVITGTRTNRRIIDVPSRIELVTPAQIEATPANSADDFLKGVSGVALSRPAGVYSSKTIVSLRGMGGEQARTLILKDGIPFNKTDGGSVNWNFFNADNIERVEIVKGAGSSIYGGNAMGGVIHYFTRKPEKPLQGSISQNLGTFNTLQTKADLKGRTGNFFWNVDGFYRKGDGYVTTPVDDINEYTIASNLDEYLVNLSAGYFITPNHSIEIGGGYFDDKRGTGSSYFKDFEQASEEGTYNSHKTQSANAIYKGIFSNGGQVNIGAYYRQEDYSIIRESLRGTNLERFDVISIRNDQGVLGSYTQRFGNHNLIAGIDFKNGAVDGLDKYITSTDQVINKGSMNNLGVFLQDEYSIGESGLSLLGSLRYDYAKFYKGEFTVINPTNVTKFLQDFDGPLDNAVWNAVTPKVSAQYLKEGIFRTYISYSKGFRPPVLDDMCRTGRISGGMKIANPELKPEFIDNFELGADLMVIKNFHLAASGFYALGKDYLHYISTGDSIRLNNRWRPIKKMDNIAQVEIKGLELDAKYRIGQALELNAAYTYTSAQVKDFTVVNPATDTDITGKKLSYHPENIFYGGITWRNPIVNIFAGFNYKDKQFVDDINEEALDAFYTIDLKLWRSLFNYLEISVMAHNLADKKYIDSRSIVAPGRILQAELKFKF